MVKSETRRDAEILVRNPSPRLFGKKFRDSKKVKTKHAKTRLRDLSKTLPRFRDPAKIFRDPRFSRYHSPPLLVVNNQELECVESAKLLGVTISNNLTWNMHIDQIIKKASKRMYFLIQLKRANVARHELILFYTSCIKSVMTYASPAFFCALPLYLKKDLENVEKRALSTICPGLAYRKALELSNIMSINDYIVSLCKKTFLSIANDPAHRLNNTLQSSGPSCYNLRCKRRFKIPKCKTERFKNSFFSKIMY